MKRRKKTTAELVSGLVMREISLDDIPKERQHFIVWLIQRRAQDLEAEETRISGSRQRPGKFVQIKD